MANLGDYITEYLKKFKNIEVSTPFHLVEEVLLKDISNFINSLEKELKIKAKKKYLPMQKGDVFSTLSDSKLLKRITGYNPKTDYRKGIKDGNNLELTHGLNGIRNTAKNRIQEVVGGRKDYKIDCLAAEFKDWDISW